ncbi:MAG: hypothetical protein V3T43_01540 [Nitrosomonadaceae bacterium]
MTQDPKVLRVSVRYLVENQKFGVYTSYILDAIFLGDAHRHINLVLLEHFQNTSIESVLLPLTVLNLYRRQTPGTDYWKH